MAAAAISSLSACVVNSLSCGGRRWGRSEVAAFVLAGRSKRGCFSASWQEKEAGSG